MLILLPLPRQPLPLLLPLLFPTASAAVPATVRASAAANLAASAAASATASAAAAVDAFHHATTFHETIPNAVTPPIIGINGASDAASPASASIVRGTAMAGFISSVFDIEY